MIENERQHKVTKIKLARLEAAYKEAQQELAPRLDIPEIVRQGYLNGIQFLMDDLKAELAKYELRFVKGASYG